MLWILITLLFIIILNVKYVKLKKIYEKNAINSTAMIKSGLKVFGKSAS